MDLLVPPIRGGAVRREPPSFSIVIPVYQAARTVGDSVRSALAQTRPAHEVIVVDDGSTDDLDACLREFDGAITVIRKRNGGAASARNAGVNAATGDFVAFLDADDVYYPRRLEALAELASARPDLDIVCTDSNIAVEGHVVARFSDATPFATADQRPAIMRACFVGGWPAIRTRRLLEIGGFDESLRIAHDWDCVLRLILDGSLAGLVDEPLHEYRLTPGALTSSRLASLWERVLMLEKAKLNGALRPEDRRPLDRCLRHHKTRAVLAEIERALAPPRNTTRGRIARLGLSRDVTPRARLLAAVAAVAPGFARKLIPRDSGAFEQRARSAS